MGKAESSNDFKRIAVKQIVDRGYPVSEASWRLGVSTHSLYAWLKQFGRSGSSGEDEQAAEIR